MKTVLVPILEDNGMYQGDFWETTEWEETE